MTSHESARLKMGQSMTPSSLKWIQSRTASTAAPSSVSSSPSNGPPGAIRIMKNAMATRISSVGIAPSNRRSE